MSYTLQLPPAVVSDAKVYASSCGTTLSHLVKMYIIELSTRKPELKKRKLGIADGECRIPTMEADGKMANNLRFMALNSGLDNCGLRVTMADGFVYVTTETRGMMFIIR